MASAATAQTWIVGFGTVLLLATVVLTAWASHAAHEAVRVTRDIGQKQVRSYVTVTKARIKLPSADEIQAIRKAGKNVCPTIEIQFKNFGASPAKNCWYSARIKYLCVFVTGPGKGQFAERSSRRHDVSQGRKTNWHHRFTIPPSESETQSSTYGYPLADVELQALSLTDDQAPFYIHVCVDVIHTDVFDVDWTDQRVFMGEIERRKLGEWQEMEPTSGDVELWGEGDK
ncbi:hypothetical protein AWH62_14790 [Maricaulis sp. W15]|nr:hypothetical protein AWH62_14790 [Maricaulis sp. W15]